MSAATTPRNTVFWGNDVALDAWTLPVKANAVIQPGTLVCVDSSGFAVAGATALGLVAMGTSVSTLVVDATGLANGALTVQVQPGTMSLANSAGGDAVVATTPPGSNLYIVDNQTLALTDGNGTRSFCGRLAGLDTTSASAPGVYVTVGYFLINQGAANPKMMITTPCPDNTKIADGVIATITPNFAGRIVKLHYITWAPVTTPAKLSNINADIAGVPTTGGVLALTSATMTPIGAEVISSAVTALNSFAAGQVITLVASGTVAFTEGSGAFVIELG